MRSTAERPEGRRPIPQQAQYRQQQIPVDALQVATGIAMIF
ncbi:hypothetical protein RF182_04240 [Escherichia coli]|nr:hypothetical protein [Escherichia coli]MDQ9259316.1 hypothetical protein [Escherichia coli]